MPSPCVGRPFGLMANATGEMPFSVLQHRDSSSRGARPITPLRDGPGWSHRCAEGDKKKSPAGFAPGGAGK